MEGKGKIRKKSLTPRFIRPALATLVKDFPTQGVWSYEIKYDGYRLLTVIKNGQPILITRNNQNWSEKFKLVIQELKKFPMTDGILDGEIVAVDDQGISKFQLLQNAIQNKVKTKLIYYIFDLPYDNGKDLTLVPLSERRKILKSYFNKAKFGTDLIQYSKDLNPHHIKKTFAELCKRGYEGVIAKNSTSPYQSARTKDWLKIKCYKRQEFVIGGYTDPAGSRKWFGALLLGYFDKNKNLIYCGKVGTGFDNLILKDVFSHLKKNIQVKCPFAQTPKWKNAHWLKPVLIAEIKFEEWTKINYLRQAVFQGLRFDKAAKEIVKEL